MSYTPNSVQVYTAAFTGCVAGINAFRRLFNTNVAAYNDTMRVADAWAQSIDGHWVGTPTLLDVYNIQGMSMAEFIDRYPNPKTEPLSVVPNEYASQAMALLAQVQSAANRYAAEGIIPPAVPGGAISPSDITPGADGSILETIMGTAVWGTPGYAQIGAPAGTESITPQEFQSTVNNKGTEIDRQPQKVNTTDATPAVCAFLDTSGFSDGGIIITAVISAIKANGQQQGAYVRTAAFRRTLGILVQTGTTQDGGTFEDDAAWDTTMAANGDNIEVQVTGKAATNITWTSVFTALQVVP